MVSAVPSVVGWPGAPAGVCGSCCLECEIVILVCFLRSNCPQIIIVNVRSDRNDLVMNCHDPMACQPVAVCPTDCVLVSQHLRANTGRLPAERQFDGAVGSVGCCQDWQVRTFPSALARRGSTVSQLEHMQPAHSTVNLASLHLQKVDLDEQNPFRTRCRLNSP